MKKYNINVNGKSYEVEVEEIGGSSAPFVAAAPAPKAAAPAAAPKAAPAPKAAAPAAAPAAGSEVITAPMPGKIIKVLVNKGQAVNSGDVVVVLEAMKMENQLFAGASGTVSEIRVAEGDAVKPGDVLVVIA